MLSLDLPGLFIMNVPLKSLFVYLYFKAPTLMEDLFPEILSLYILLFACLSVCPTWNKRLEKVSATAFRELFMILGQLVCLAGVQIGISRGRSREC